MNKIILIISALLALSACKSTPQVVYLKPECSVPVRAELPEIDAGELWDAVGAETYDKLADRERLIVDWAKEMQYMLQVICNG
jgi:hypothetical protein